MTELKDASYWAEQIKNKHISPAELLQFTENKIEQLNPQYNAVVAHDLPHAIADLPTTTQGFFAGVPFPLKMLGQSHQGLPDTAGSKLFQNAVATADDAYVQRIIRAGLTPFGQTNAPEFGFKNVTDPELYGPTRNVWNTDYFPGGSSGGAASAVAAGIFPMAGASDGGGSIRIPSSWSGLIGLKSTRGRMPQGPGSYRGWQGASIAGSLTISVRDLARFLAEMQVVQEGAPYQAPLLPTDELLNLTTPKRPLKIAYSLASPFPEVTISEQAQAAIKKAINFLIAQEHEVEEVPFPITNARPLIETYYQMNAAETTAMLQPYEEQVGHHVRRDDVELLTYALLETGRNVPVTTYIHALDSWDAAAATMEQKIFNQYDLFLTPTTGKTAAKIGVDLNTKETQEKMAHITEFSFQEQAQIISAGFSGQVDRSPYNFLANLTGQPALSLPVYVDENTNLPLGIQLWGPKNSEITLLSLAKQFEEHEQFILPAAYR